MSTNRDSAPVSLESRIYRTTWIVWGVSLLAYLALNAWFVFGRGRPGPEVLLGWGIALPILTNLCWWAISFRLRYRLARWWIFGLSTAAVVGVAGFLSMLAIARMMTPG